MQSLLVWDGLRAPVGPCGVVGEIVLTQEIEAMLRRREFNAVRYVIAHELTHVFDALPWVVPAAEDWDAYCTNFNPLGLDAEDLIEDRRAISATLDDYGSDEELALITRYWGSHGKTWFDDFHSRHRQP